MKIALAVLLAITGLATAQVTTAHAATTDDAKPAVVLKYCTCMNNKMDNNETQSITQWEKTHVAERKACDKEAGWK